MKSSTMKRIEKIVARVQNFRSNDEYGYLLTDGDVELSIEMILKEENVQGNLTKMSEDLLAELKR